ncbi:MAG TPA: L-rhamnose/proton symporter RhaT [Alloacidobacterium sp.]|nr:L-rhamnose/proton symporter RhaT [Alloacidobacterium sp.]
MVDGLGSWLGIVIGGALNGSFAVPMKRARVWRFEHIWGLFSILAMVVIPWSAILIAVPEWKGLIAAIPLHRLAALVALGLIWGVASLLYGLAIDLLGIALGISIQLGLSIVVGALVPFAIVRGIAFRTISDWVFLLGVITMVVGVTLCATAGTVSRGAGTAARSTDAERAKFRKGLIIAALGGLGSPLLNLGIQYGTSLMPRFTRTDTLVPWLAWAILLSAGAVSQAGWCFYRLVVTHQAALFQREGSGRDAIFVSGMAVIWMISIFLYARGATSLGSVGTSVGWPVFIGLIVIASNGWGVSLGEWRERPRANFYQMIAGSGVLIIATFIIAWARSSW